MIEKVLAKTLRNTAPRALAASLLISLGAANPALAQGGDAWSDEEDSVIRRSPEEDTFDGSLVFPRGGRRRGYRDSRALSERDLDSRPERDEEPDWQEPQYVDQETEIFIDERFFAQGKLRLSGFAVPYIDIDADKDSGEKDQDVHFEDSLRSGSGFGFRLGFGNTCLENNGLYANLGLLYIFSVQETRNFKARVNGHMGFLDLVLGARAGNDVLRAYVEGGLSIGGVGLDFKRGLDDEGGAAYMTRIGAGLTFFQQLSLGASAGFLEFGYPTETIGRARFASIDFQFDF